MSERTREIVVPILVGAVAATYGIVNFRRLLAKVEPELRDIWSGVVDRLDPDYWAKHSTKS